VPGPGEHERSAVPHSVDVGVRLWSGAL